jgi:hypothetical protein
MAIFAVVCFLSSLVVVVFVLPNGIALVAAWIGDNQGPGDYEAVQAFFAYLNSTFPQAEVKLGPFDEFFSIANQPEVKGLLPVVTGRLAKCRSLPSAVRESSLSVEEIGDGWLYGVPSDPLKNAQFRALSALRKGCLDNGTCDVSHPAMVAFDRLMVKVPEHTWGVAQSWFLPDYANWYERLKGTEGDW